MKEYIVTLIGAALICTAADMLAPDRWQGYIRLITGLVIISVILAPVSRLRGIDIFADFEIPEIPQSEEYDERLMVAAALKERIDEDINERMREEFGLEDVGADTELELTEDNEIASVKSITVERKIPKAAEERLQEVYGACEVIIR